MMNTADAAKLRRSIRKFLPKEVSAAELRELVSLSRLYASAANLQPVRYAIIFTEKNRDTVFSALRWAKLLDPYVIEKNERPMAYILLLGKRPEHPYFEFDAGCAATTLMLCATEMGLDTCCLKIAEPQIIADAFDFGEFYPVYAVALGYGAIQSRFVTEYDSVRYRADENGNFTVPKRTLEELILVDDTQK